MKVSELIKSLQELEARYGDLPAYHTMKEYQWEVHKVDYERQ